MRLETADNLNALLQRAIRKSIERIVTEALDKYRDAIKKDVLAGILDLQTYIEANVDTLYYVDRDKFDVKITYNIPDNFLGEK